MWMPGTSFFQCVSSPTISDKLIGARSSSVRASLPYNNRRIVHRQPTSALQAIQWSLRHAASATKVTAALALYYY
jgi:hypothetical protein